MRICSAIVVLALVALPFGCGGGSDTVSSAANGSAAGSTTASATDEEKSRYPVPESSTGKGPLEKLVVENLEVGDGPVARCGDEVAVRYVVVYYETGKLYSQHWGSTYEFKLDGETIGPGWQKGIHGMRVGGRREILIPSRLIFGGSDGDLAYVLELVEVKPGPRGKKPTRTSHSSTVSYDQEGPFAAITIRGQGKPEIEPPDRPAPKKLLHRDLEEGSGQAARHGDLVDIDYDGAIYRTGELRYGGSTQPFALGLDGLGKPFERGIEGMKAGGRRELILPSRFINGSPAVDYVIELVSLESASGNR